MIPARLKKAREASGLTQEKAAELSLCDFRDIQKYESGDTTPLTHRMIRICNVYGVSIDWVLGRESRNLTPEKEEGLTIADMVYYLRKKRGLSIENTRKLSGVSETSITSIERGGQLQLETAEKLADFFSVSVDYLCGRGNYDGI